MTDNLKFLPSVDPSAVNIAADEIGGIRFQRIKLTWGVDGVAVDASATNPLPITIHGSDVTVESHITNASIPVTDNGGSLTVDGTVTVQDGGGSISIDDNAGSITVDGAVTVSSGSITADTELPTAATLADGTANPSLPSVGAFNLLYNGTTWDRFRGDVTSGLDVDVTRVQGSVAVVQSGTWTIQPGNTANTTAWKVDGSAVTQPVSGTVAVTNSDVTATATVLGTAADLAASTGSTGTVSAKLRDISTQIGSVSSATGSTGDAAVAAGATGTLSAKFRRLTTDIDAIKTSTALISSIGDGRKVVTTAGTRVALASTTSVRQVAVTAEVGNTGVIVIGGSTVIASASTRRGIPLYPGDSVGLEIDDLADVFIDSTVNGEGVTFTYLA